MVQTVITDFMFPLNAAGFQVKFQRGLTLATAVSTFAVNMRSITPSTNLIPSIVNSKMKQEVHDNTQDMHYEILNLDLYEKINKK